jgi:hypothetical protein
MRRGEVYDVSSPHLQNRTICETTGTIIGRHSIAWRAFEHHFLSALIAGTVAVLITASSLAQPAFAQARRTVVFVVSRSDPQEAQSNMDAVLMIENGRLKAPYSEQSEAAQKRFASEYFSPGKTYRVTFGGGEVGSATVKDSSVGCNNIHGRATVEHGGKIPVHLSGLATNSASIGKRPSTRRAPTPTERAAVMKLVDQTYRTRRTPAAWLRNLQTTNLTATDLDGDGKFELIGSFVIETSAKQRRDLLLIAEPLGEGFKPAFVNFQSYKLIPEGFDSAIDFIDQLDVDGDGVGEVFTMQHGFDAYGFNIYKKVRGRWRLMLSTVGDAC